MICADSQEERQAMKDALCALVDRVYDNGIRWEAFAKGIRLAYFTDPINGDVLHITASCKGVLHETAAFTRPEPA